MPTPLKIINNFNAAEARRWARRSLVNDLLGLYHDIRKTSYLRISLAMAGIFIASVTIILWR